MKLSIITVNLNNAIGLKRTIESVLNQNYLSYQYIIIDGCSTDNSINIIKQNSNRIDYWISELDSGIYQAMNKGIKVAKGDYCLFLNSGDWLVEPDTLKNLFDEDPKSDIISGDVYFYDNVKEKIKWHIFSPDQITAKVLFLGTLPHQATLIRRNLFDTIGLYNEKLKIASDWLFFVEALLVHGSTYQHYKAVVAYFSMDGISCDPKMESLPRREQLSILQRKYPLFLPDYDQFDQLEKKSYNWLQSGEYRVYLFMKRIGFIRLGLLARRVKRLFIRSLFRTY